MLLTDYKRKKDLGLATIGVVGGFKSVIFWKYDPDTAEKTQDESQIIDPEEVQNATDSLQLLVTDWENYG